MVLTVSSEYIAAATPATPGTGYAPGNTIRVLGAVTYIGETEAQLTVTTAPGGAVSAVAITHDGKFAERPASPVATVAQTGTGTDFTFTPTWARDIYAPNS